jgi:threonine dehydrogenase-like Zn-dependent dehydrogenase
MEELLKLLARKRLHPEETATHRFTLGEAAYRLFD